MKRDGRRILFEGISNCRDLGGLQNAEGQTIRDLYEERKLLYSKYADITVSEADLDMEETVDSIRKGIVVYQSRK